MLSAGNIAKMPPEVSHDIIRYGYAAIFLLIFLQEIGVPNPVPNELVLMFSGYLAFTGLLKLPLIILSAITADFIGTNILYFVFYFFGVYILQHKPRWLPVSKTAIDKLSRRISKGGKWTIYIGRLTPFLRGYTSVITGLLQIKPKVFLPIALISAMTWSGFYAIMGKLLGPYWSHVTGNMSSIKYIFLIALSIIFLLIITRFILNRGLKNN